MRSLAVDLHSDVIALYRAAEKRKSNHGEAESCRK
jgi:hypothetical protein